MQIHLFLDVSFYCVLNLLVQIVCPCSVRMAQIAQGLGGSESVGFATPDSLLYLHTALLLNVFSRRGESRLKSWAPFL